MPVQNRMSFVPSLADGTKNYRMAQATRAIRKTAASRFFHMTALLVAAYVNVALHNVKQSGHWVATGARRSTSESASNHRKAAQAATFWVMDSGSIRSSTSSAVW